MRSILYVLLVLILAACSSAEKSEDYLIVLSVDGFRWDYTEGVHTPNFDKMAEMGVKANSLRPSFPTKTFPNHYAMATGLYPDNHGIVLNSFYAADLNEEYKISNRKAVANGAFYGGEPIWVTAEKQGVKSASLFWVGASAQIKGVTPTYGYDYNPKISFESRIDTVLHWITLPENERPRLVMWYIEEPDGVGHKYGPKSLETNTMVQYIDSLIGEFMKRIAALPYADKINVVVCSDHGMGAIQNERKVAILDYIPKSWTEKAYGSNPVYGVHAKAGFADSIVAKLEFVEGVDVWRTDDVPEEMNYGTNPRIGDVVIVAEQGWSLVMDSAQKVGNGTHGYSNFNKDMEAIFFAYGPAFKENKEVRTFDNIDLYSIFAKVLDLEPVETDGSIDDLDGMFSE